MRASPARGDGGKGALRGSRKRGSGEAQGSIAQWIMAPHHCGVGGTARLLLGETITLKGDLPTVNIPHRKKTREREFCFPTPRPEIK